MQSGSFLGANATPMTELAEMRASAVLSIDLTALAENYRALKSEAGKAKCGAVVKADAYGVGMDYVAPILWNEGCRHFFVALLDEGLALRRILPHARIYLLNGLLKGTEDETCLQRLTPCLNKPEEITAWAETARKHKTRLPAVIHIDTGMNRLGLTPADLDRLAEEGIPSVLNMRFIMSHLAVADSPRHVLNLKQLERFKLAMKMLPENRGSLANSAGIFLGKKYHYHLLRPGIALYGGDPTHSTKGNPMKPVIHIKGRILQIREIQKGESLGYGADGVVKRDSRIATVAIGYGDGLPRSLSSKEDKSKFSFLIDGKKAPILGRVSMETVMVDVTDHSAITLRAGGFAVLLNEKQTIDDLAKAARCTNYEILTRLGKRYYRTYKLPKRVSETV